MKEVIQSFRQLGMQYFRTKVIEPLPLQKLHKFALVTDPYWVVNFFETDYKYIDFMKSEVNHVGIGGVKVKSLRVQSVWDFDKTERELTTIWIDKMVLSDKITDHLLNIPRVNSGPYFVSELLKEALKQAKCTGINFQHLE
jgi:hypothetical protein